MRPLLCWQYAIESKRHAIRWSSVNRPVAVIDLTDPERPRKRKAVRGAAHFRFRCDDEDVTDLTQAFLESFYAFGVVAVIISN